MPYVLPALPRLRTLTAGAAAVVLLLTGCNAGDDTAGNSTEPVGTPSSTVSAPDDGSVAKPYDPATGPAVGTCLAMETTQDVWAPDSVPCEEPHGGEVIRLLRDTPKSWHATPEKTVEWETIGDRCHDLTRDAGYDGPLLGLHASLLVTATPEDRADGGHWVACTLATYAPFTDGMPTGENARTPLAQRRGVYADIAETGRTWIIDGVRCYRYTDDGAEPADCHGKGNVWAQLTYDHGPAPFVSAEWQERVARSKCEAYGYAFGRPGYEWYTFWPKTAAELEDSRQNCLIRAGDFDPSRNVIVDLPDDVTDGLTGVTAQFAEYATRYGEAFTRDARLMTVPRNRRASMALTELVMPFTLSAWPGPGTIRTSGLSTVGIGMTHRFEVAGFHGQDCRAQLEIPLPYLTAPFAVTEVHCR